MNKERRNKTERSKNVGPPSESHTENRKIEDDADCQAALEGLLERHGLDFWKALFSLVHIFGHCECGRIPVLLNVHKGSYMYCKVCNTYWEPDFNIYSGADENESILKANAETLERARPIEELHPDIRFGEGGLVPGWMNRLMIKNLMQKHRDSHFSKETLDFLTTIKGKR